MPSFIFTIASSAWNSTYPIINTGGSFTGLTNSFTTVGTTVYVTCSWTSYTNKNTNDGLRFNTNVSYGTHPTINIVQFGGVPLSNMPTQATSTFYNFTGIITIAITCFSSSINPISG